MAKFIVIIGVLTYPHPPHKHPIPAKPPLNLQTIQAPFLGNSVLYIGYSWSPLIKRIFSGPV